MPLNNHKHFFELWSEAELTSIFSLNLFGWCYEVWTTVVSLMEVKDVQSGRCGNVAHILQCNRGWSSTLLGNSTIRGINIPFKFGAKELPPAKAAHQGSTSCSDSLLAALAAVCWTPAAWLASGNHKSFRNRNVNMATVLNQKVL